MARPGKARDSGPLIPEGTKVLEARWPFPVAVAMGSSVRFKGIDREVRLRLPFPVRAYLASDAAVFTLRMPDDQEDAFQAACETIETVLSGIDTLQVLPSEAEEILTILPRERLKWTKDGRLLSAGTKTVKMRGRAKAVTFHVHDPRHIEEVLDRDMPTAWREADAAETAENRRKGAGKAALTRSGKSGPTVPIARRSKRQTEAVDLAGWREFDADGLLR